jgi:hypothetical protein
MDKRLLTLILTTSITLVACNKQQNTEEKSVDKKTEDIIYISDKDVSFGYYKSSIIKVNNNLNVWLHIPKANQSSKKEIERMSEVLLEISCEKHQLRMLKITDTIGNEIAFAGDEKWKTPSPASEYYKVIIKVCNDSK